MAGLAEAILYDVLVNKITDKNCVKVAQKCFIKTYSWQKYDMDKNNTGWY